MSIEDLLQEILQKATISVYGEKSSVSFSIGFPPKIEMGDFAVGCFAMAKQFKMSPSQIATKLADKLQGNEFGKFKAVGSYINIIVNNNILFSSICNGDSMQIQLDSQTVMVEYLSPNTNKPLHLGHVRNGVTGMAVSNILEYVGYNVIKANLVNDRGVHICKSMLAWQMFANGATPSSEGIKGDHFVGDYYVKFAQVAKKDPSMEDKAQELLEKWEEGDIATIKLWKMMNSWVYAGFAESYAKFGFDFDVEYYESEIYKTGKSLVQEGLEKGVFVREPSGAVVFNLSEEEFGTNEDGSLKKVTLLRDNGTSVYATQDIAVAAKKAMDYNFDVSVHVVAEEQEYYFKTLFAIFKALDYTWADKCYHLSYGMVELPTGRMKSREGTVVDADDLAQSVIDLATTEITAKHGSDLSKAEVIERAEKIGLGAIKFYLLNTNPKNKILFNPEKSISFNGVTGPYVQYAYARAMSISEKAQQEGILVCDSSLELLGGNNEERLLAQKLVSFPHKISKAALAYNPSILTDAIYELAKAFHQFYNKQQVVIDDTELAGQRLFLVNVTAKTLKTGLSLLGIEVLSKM